MTTPYHLKISPAAARKIRLLTSKQKKMILNHIETLAVNPRPPGVQKIQGMFGLYCEEIHTFRLIYKVEEQEVLLLLVK